MDKIFRIIKIERISVSEKGVLAFSIGQRVMLGILINIIGPIVPLIAADLGVGLDYIGRTISLGTFALLLTSVGIGYLVELFGFKRIIFSGILFIIAGCLALFFSYSYAAFTLAYFVLQFGIGIIGISTISLIGSHYFKDRAANILKANLGLAIGAIIAPLMVSLAVTYSLSWQALFVYLVIPQAGITIILFSLSIPKARGRKINLRAMFDEHRHVISHSYIILCCLVALLYVSTTQTFYTWFTSYFSAMDISLDISSLFLAVYVGANLAGMVVKNYAVKLVAEKRLLLASIMASFTFLLLAFLIPHLAAKVVFIFLFGISISGNFSLTFSMSLGIGQKFTNSISGFLHASAYGGLVLFQYLSGYLSEYFSKDSVLYIDLGLLGALFFVVLALNVKKFGRQAA
ncbi:MAG: MFS transporter [Actinomycetota bacterium]